MSSTPPTSPSSASKEPAVSVIVPAWGVAHLVGETLASLQAQTFTNWEAVVVDDGAPDDVAGAVAPFAEADPRIRFVPTPHGGLPAARNRAIAAARAPLIALLDGDDMVEPTYLEKMVAAIETDPKLGIVTCDAIFTGQPSREGHLFSAYFAQSGERSLAAVIERRFHVFITTMLRRAAIEEAGGFDESLPAAEDLDMWIRILERGWGLGQVAEPLSIYRRRPGSLSSSTLKLRQATQTVFERAAERLKGRPEQASALAMIARMREESAWVEGEDLVIAGKVSQGLRVLREARAGERSPRWRIMMRVFRLMPPLAQPVLAWRRRQEEQAEASRA